jgi:inosine-uridine nucleoside N-ribohydrolase
MPQSLPRLRVVLDTDTFNEVDDQFALAHLLLSPGQVDLEAVYAAPFFNGRSSDPADGMEKSYEEIQRVLTLVPGNSNPPVFRGSKQYLPGPAVPVESPAAADLVERAMATMKDKLHVLGIAVATNIASALLLEPRIAEKIVIVWLGGHAPYWPTADEFNLGQDVHAARILLDSKAPLVLLPCCPVTSHLATTVPELEERLAPYSALGRYLTGIIRTYAGDYPGAYSKPIWDISASAWAVNSNWITTDLCPSPVLLEDRTWKLVPDRHLIRIARQVDRDAIFTDFFTKARMANAKSRPAPGCF